MKECSAHPVNGSHREYFTEGKLSAECRFKDGKRSGKWKYFYPNGELKATGKYMRGEFDGEWQWWRENGRLLQMAFFPFSQVDAISPAQS